MISVFTVGLIGYTVDRAMQSLQRRTSWNWKSIPWKKDS